MEGRKMKKKRGRGRQTRWRQREIQGERESDRETRVVGEVGRKGEGENLLAFYVSNYMKDGITYPTDRPAGTLLPSFGTNQPTRDLLFQSSDGTPF